MYVIFIDLNFKYLQSPVAYVELQSNKCGIRQSH